LIWNSSAGAASYRLQISTDAAFGTIFYDTSGITTTYKSIGGLAGETKYFWRVSAAYSEITSAWSAVWSFTTGPAVSAGGTALLPKVFDLFQNYPNPFNPSTTIRYQIPDAARVTLKVFDMLSRQVAVLADGMREAGYYTATFDGSRLASGIYFVRITSTPPDGSKPRVKTIKMLMMK
jgi:hypothetical protein